SQPKLVTPAVEAGVKVTVSNVSGTAGEAIIGSPSAPAAQGRINPPKKMPSATRRTLFMSSRRRLKPASSMAISKCAASDFCRKCRAFDRCARLVGRMCERACARPEVPQLAALEVSSQELAVRVPRQLRDDVDLLWHLEPGEPFATEFAQ